MARRQTGSTTSPLTYATIILIQTYLPDHLTANLNFTHSHTETLHLLPYPTLLLRTPVVLMFDFSLPLVPLKLAS